MEWTQTFWQLAQAFSAPVLAGIGVLIVRGYQFLIVREKEIHNTTVSSLLQTATTYADSLMGSLVSEANQVIVNNKKESKTFDAITALQVKNSVISKFMSLFPADFKVVLAKAAVDLPTLATSLLESHVGTSRTIMASVVTPTPAADTPSQPSQPPQTTT